MPKNHSVFGDPADGTMLKDYDNNSEKVQTDLPDVAKRPVEGKRRMMPLFVLIVVKSAVSAYL